MPSHPTHASSADPSHAEAGTRDRDLLLRLRGFDVQTADARILLTVPRLDVVGGERVVVTGPSGSGKSLLLATLAGRWPASLRVSGERVATLDRIGFVPQRGLDALHPLIPLARQLRAVTRAGATRVRDTLLAVGLTDPALHRRRPAELSGGQAQRAAVALAALTDAPLILADEPTSALDHESRGLTLRLLDEVLGARRTLVVATHDVGVADALGGRHVRVTRGRVAEAQAAGAGARR